MKKIMLFPFNLKTMPIIRHKNLIGSPDLYLISTPAYYIKAKDASYMDNGCSVGLKVFEEREFSSILEEVDTVVFNEFDLNLDSEKDIFIKIDRCLEKNKEVIYLNDLKLPIIKEIQSKYSSEKFCGCKRENACLQELKNGNELFSIDVPVIFVCGIDEDCNKFDLELSIREKFLKNGYNISQVGSCNSSLLFGLHTFPSFIFNNEMSETDKIIAFNHYIKSIEMKENPDVILVGIPGDIVKLTQESINDFGITAFEVSNAIQPDYVFMCMPYGGYTLDFFEYISNMASMRFEWDINCFVMSNTVFSAVKSVDGTKDYLKLPIYEVDEKIKNISEKSNLNLINIYNDEMLEKAFVKMLDELQDNYEHEIF